MLKSLTTALAAFALVVASFGPAQADGLDRDDVGKIIIGIAAIAALNAYLESRDDDDPSTRNSNTTSKSWADLNRPRAHQEARLRALPSECIRRVPTRFGAQHIYTQSCLDRRYAQVAQLPDRCRVRARGYDGVRLGYDPLCLHQAGYRATRGH